MQKLYCIAFLLAICSQSVQAQKIDISAASSFEVVNRDISIQKTNDKTVVHLDAAENDGVAWVNNTNFSTGVIEFDIRGKDAMQQSFVGIAFRRMNDSSYDCIYFRPFNFNSTDPTRKSHSVQYISMPHFDWQYLREKFPNKYENSLTDSIGSNNWFHAKVNVRPNQIEVFVNNNSKPSLTIMPLNNYTAGKVGFWVGNNSEGDFSNLILKTD